MVTLVNKICLVEPTTYSNPQLNVNLSAWNSLKQAETNRRTCLSIGQFQSVLLVETGEHR